MMAPEKPRLILASASPRRLRILQDAGYDFEVMDPGNAEDEVRGIAEPDALALAKSRAKAGWVARTVQGKCAVVIGADTLVAWGDEILEKPLNRNDAVEILTRLSGTRHRVITGLCLCPTSRALDPVAEAVTTWVTMRPMSAGDIQDYVDSGEADGKAGAYAIQETGDRFVDHYEGSFLNIVGFPLERFREVLPGALADWGWM